MNPEDVAKTLASGKTTAKADPAERTEAQVNEFVKKYALSAEASATLHKLVSAAIDERLAEFSDIRVGRVLGAALAHL